MDYKNIILSSDERSKFSDMHELDQLDPCCQKEIIQERQSNDIKKQLRKYDRSNTALDIKNNIFKFNADNLKLFSCQCCEIPSVDYKSLTKLKSMKYCEEITVIDKDKDLDEDSNNESSDDDLDLDDFISEFEINRKLEVQKNIEKMNCYKRIGYGQHINESIEHLTVLVQSLPFVIVHIYQDTYMDAQIDMFLEKLAQIHVGTIFRRIDSSTISSISQLFDTLGLGNNDSNSVLSYSSSSASNTGNTTTLRDIDGNLLNHDIMDINKSASSCLIGFNQQQISFLISDFSEYFNNSHSYTSNNNENLELYDDVLLRYFHMKNILSPFPTENDIGNYQLYMQRFSDTNPSDENDEDNIYCDDSTCTRRFPHQHIGTVTTRTTGNNGASKKTTKSLLGLLKQPTAADTGYGSQSVSAADLLPPNYFTKL